MEPLMKTAIRKTQLAIFGTLLLLIALFAVAVVNLDNYSLQTGLSVGVLLAVGVLTSLLLTISKPLSVLTQALQQQNALSLQELTPENNEFGQLARLIQDYFQQQQDLNYEVEKGRQIAQQLQLFSCAIEQSNNLVIITDPLGIIEYVNPHFVKVTGYGVAEISGTNARLLKSNRIPKEWYQQLLRTISNGSEWHGELCSQRKDGSTYWALASIVPFRDQTGAITHFIATQEDITQQRQTESALRASELKYRNVFATVGDAMFLIDSRDGRILTVNPAASKLYGYSRKELLGMRDIDLAAEPSAEAALPRIESKRLTGQWHRRKDGTTFPADLWVRHFSYKGNTITVAASRDMSLQKLAEEKIGRLSSLYAALSRTSAAVMRQPQPQNLFQQVCQIIAELEQISLVAIGLVDTEGRLRQLAQASSVDSDSIQPPQFPLASDAYLAEGPECWTVAFYSGAPVVINDFINDSNQLPYHDWATQSGICAAAAFPLRRNDSVVGFLTTFATDQGFFEADITHLLTNLAGELSFALHLFERETQREMTSQHIQHLATHDALTGLPNRTLLLDRLSQAIHSAHRKQHCVGILFIDLNRFKLVNDSLGHEIGDQLLQLVAERLRGSIRQEDTLARQGGDEFILVLPNMSEPSTAGRVAKHLLSALGTPFVLNEHLLHINASIGISIYPLDSTDAATLIRLADSAMYKSKAAGRGHYSFYADEHNLRTSELLGLGGDLQQALERDEFVLHYQPKIELSTRRIISMEALIRWQHPEKGLLPPLEFVPVAEEIGLISAIGEWTLQTACAQSQRWQAAGLPSLPIAVNLSIQQWLQPTIEQQVTKALTASNLPAHLLELEINESLLIRATDKMLEIMRRLHTIGVQLIMDNFGIGYCSLRHLKQFPLDQIKISQHLIQSSIDEADNAAIAAAIMQMGKVLGLGVVASGVETAEQAQLLRQQGCDIAQGFYFSEPQPAEYWLDFLNNGRTAI